MHLRQQVSACLGCFFIFRHAAFCAPTQRTVSRALNAGNGLNIINPASLFSDAICGEAASSSTSDAVKVGIDRMTWQISETLSLALVICNWEPDPNTIQAVLRAAEMAVGKKPAAERLDRKFTQKSNNRYNTLLFEISSDYTDKRLTWGDVGEVLGENGLLTFYVTPQLWHTVYFDVVHTTRGELGHGAVRRWWQLEPPNGANGTSIWNSGLGVDLYDHWLISTWKGSFEETLLYVMQVERLPTVLSLLRRIREQRTKMNILNMYIYA